MEYYSKSYNVFLIWLSAGYYPQRLFWSYCLDNRWYSPGSAFWYTCLSGNVLWLCEMFTMDDLYVTYMLTLHHSSSSSYTYTSDVVYTTDHTVHHVF